MYDLPKYIETDPIVDMFDREMDSAIKQIVQNITRTIDAACVVAREKGCGVKVTRYPISGRMFIEVTDKVPTGEIHYYDEFGPEGEFEPL